MNDQKQVEEWIDRYLAVSFSAMKKGENLVKESIGDFITIDQHYTLRYIHKVGTCTFKELSALLNVKKSVITAITNRLIEKELMKRTRDENDRRVIYLTLTDKGEELFEKTEEKIRRVVDSIITGFSTSEVVSFIESYEKFNLLLDNYKECKVEEEE
ncbi:MarR family winged helix-turn-helix transcriptional regulator [Bacillus weihaiensis]|uniref:MarR family winged helix-turn-helix transcriptional regulator n=1 Tax=Bacillus weihaiensis TaxID=1547283 RepID=UPI002354AFB4|nr:MarR family transcriptional regulator [Bacillus weihaiensis]